MLTQWQIRAVDAVDILNQQGINQWQFDRGELGPVYISDTGPRNVAREAHQATEKAIMATGMSLLRVLNDAITDQWLYNGAVIREYFNKHYCWVPLLWGYCL